MNLIFGNCPYETKKAKYASNSEHDGTIKEIVDGLKNLLDVKLEDAGRVFVFLFTNSIRLILR